MHRIVSMARTKSKGSDITSKLPNDVHKTKVFDENSKNSKVAYWVKCKGQPWSNIV